MSYSSLAWSNADKGFRYVLLKLIVSRAHCSSSSFVGCARTNGAMFAGLVL